MNREAFTREQYAHLYFKNQSLISQHMSTRVLWDKVIRFVQISCQKKWFWFLSDWKMLQKRWNSTDHQLDRPRRNDRNSKPLLSSPEKVNKDHSKNKVCNNLTCERGSQGNFWKTKRHLFFWMFMFISPQSTQCWTTMLCVCYKKKVLHLITIIKSPEKKNLYPPKAQSVW